MNDNISAMRRTELEKATRRLLNACTESRVKDGDLPDAIAAFRPSPLDELREWLKANGWWKRAGGMMPGNCVEIEIVETGIPERWTHRVD